MPPPKYACNDVVGDLTVVEVLQKKDKRGYHLYRVRCSCGNEEVVNTSKLGYYHRKCVSCLKKDRTERDSTYLTVGGVRRTMSEWAEETGIDKHTIHSRIRSGWSAEDAVTKPVRPRGIEVDGELISETALCKKLGLSRGAIYERLNRGWSLKEATTTKGSVKSRPGGGMVRKVRNKIAYYESKYGFHPHLSVEDIKGKSKEANRAYGGYMELVELMVASGRYEEVKK
jgi:hypothetical protein